MLGSFERKRRARETERCWVPFRERETVREGSEAPLREREGEREYMLLGERERDRERDA